MNRKQWNILGIFFLVLLIIFFISLYFHKGCSIYEENYSKQATSLFDIKETVNCSLYEYLDPLFFWALLSLAIICFILARTEPKLKK